MHQTHSHKPLDPSPNNTHINKALGTSRAQGFVFTIVQLTSDQ